MCVSLYTVVISIRAPQMRVDEMHMAATYTLRSSQLVPESNLTNSSIGASMTMVWCSRAVVDKIDQKW